MRLASFLARVALGLTTSAVDITFEVELARHRGPILFVANHVSSADSWVALAITASLRRNPAVLAQARVLRSFPWLARLGFISLSKKNPASVLEAFQETSRRASDDPDLAIWFYPQGTHSPSSAARSPLQPGILGLLRMLPEHTLVVPVAFHYFVFRQPRMAICAMVAKPIADAGLMAKSGRGALLDIDTHLTRASANAANQVAGAAARIKFPFEREDSTL